VTYTGLTKVFAGASVRTALAWVFAVVVVLSARDYPHWPGSLICGLGAALRVWSSGYLVKNDGLTVDGPYRWTRNPLYLGTYLMAIGATISMESVWLTVVLSSVFAIVYHYVILAEEIKLEARFGAAYVDYMELTPRFFPGRKRATTQQLRRMCPEARYFSVRMALENKAYEAVLAFVGLVGLVGAVGAVWKELL
jgi:protein-S-isoprenylcysteine O-methyltransferase Ste14